MDCRVTTPTHIALGESGFHGRETVERGGQYQVKVAAIWVGAQNYCVLSFSRVFWQVLGFFDEFQGFSGEFSGERKGRKRKDREGRGKRIFEIEI